MEVSAATPVPLSPSPPLPLDMYSSMDTTNLSTIEEETPCEQCKAAVASVECRGCLMDGEPFYYCKSCSDMIHVGNRKCSHPLTHLVHVDELKRNMKATLDLVEKSYETDKASIAKAEELKADVVTRSENLTAECKYLFSDLRTLLDNKEKELINYFESKHKEGLELASAEKEKCESRIVLSGQMKEDLKQLIELPVEEFKEQVLTVIPEVNNMEGVFNASNESSLLKLESLLSQLSFLPDTNNLKSFILSYCVPYRPEWNEGDSVLVVAPALNVDSNGHFWLQEPSTPAVLGHLSLISQTLTNMANSRRVRSTDTQFSQGDICAAFYPRDSQWHRAYIEKVMSKDHEQKMLVRYLDYGNTEELYHDCLMALPSRMKEYPFQCRRCKFSDDITVQLKTCREAKWKYSDLAAANSMTAIILEKSVVPEAHIALFTIQLFIDDVDIGERVLEVVKDVAARKKEPYPMMCKDIRYIDKAPPIESDSAHASTPPPFDVLALLDTYETGQAESGADTKSKGTDQQGTGQQGTDQQGTDPQGTDQRGTDQQGSESDKTNTAEVGLVVEAPPTESIEDDIVIETTDVATGLLEVSGASDNEATGQLSADSKDDMGVVPMELVTSNSSFSSVDEKGIDGVKPDINTDLNTDLNTDINASEVTNGVALTDAPPTNLIDESVPAKTEIDIDDNDNVDLKSVDTGVNITDNADSTDRKSSVDSNTDTTIVNEGTDTNDDTITEMNPDLLPSVAAVTNLKDNKEEHTPPATSTGPEAAAKDKETITVHYAAGQNTTEQTTAANSLVEDNTGSSNTGLMNDSPTTTECIPIPIATNVQTVPVANEGSHFNEEAPSLIANHLISTPLVHDHSSVSSSPLDSTSKKDVESDSHTLISDADHESDFGDEKKRQKIKRSFTHRSNNKLSLPTDSDTTADDTDSVSQASPLKTTPPTKSLPKLTLDLSSQLAAEEVGGVTCNPDSTVYHPLIVEGAKLSVIINSGLDSSGYFWCQISLDDVETDIYAKLFDKLQEHAESKGQYTPVFFNPGDLCLAVFSEDGLWYRSKVEAIGEENTLSLRFMDYGNCESVPVTNVMALKSTFKALPFQAFRCCLSDKEKTTFTRQECHRFDNIIQDSSSATAVVESVLDSVVYVKILIDKEGKEVDLLSSVSTSKSRSYSFEMTPEEENVEGLTWAERTDRDLYTHSDSDVFLKSNAAAPKVGGERVCAGTDIDDPWNSETESRTLTLNKKSPLPKRKDSFEKRGRASNMREPIKSSVATATRSSAPLAPNGSPTPLSTAADTKKPLKNRAVVNTSGIAKYLGRDDKKVVLARRDVEEKNGKQGSPPPRTVWNIDAAPKSLPTRQRTLSGSTTDSTASTDRRTTFESSSAEPQSKGGRGRGRGGPRRGGASVAGRDTAHIPDTQDIVSLFVKNIPSSYSIQDIIDGFSPFGKVYDVRRLPHKGKRGEKIHYVDMLRPNAMKAIKGLDGFKVPSATRGLFVRLDYQFEK
ncbi:PREDICTED: uncharacterized protein LOC100631754 isoform X2 [Amphimedon queenslandica]|uniref:Tudor domain-containing protein n=1 Tax=Amphimedon queenslandica TaxID=400682 RepID=A0A1X7TYJ9_AMPQE|nr:PREDICTED: uncharacterized protein LOC100631754 isoform X2 [Amphimedon queenslandica]|eukprot:XP_019856937.1 PREDICTED: uncharacterized protein LOC100631754 isoform X2 [Amphimedon queenslandica]